MDRELLDPEFFEADSLTNDELQEICDLVKGIEIDE
jgi:hypothetical protein